MSMFCYQCEQTAQGTGCTRMGVCGKTPEVAALQDLLVYAVKGLSAVAERARSHGVSDPEINRFTSEAMFSTLTNVNFDPERFVTLIDEAVGHRESLKKRIDEKGGSIGGLSDAIKFTPTDTMAALVEQAGAHSILADKGDDAGQHENPLVAPGLPDVSR